MVLLSVPVIDRTQHEYFTETAKVQKIACDIEHILHWQREDYILGSDDYNDDDDDDDDEDDNNAAGNDRAADAIWEVYNAYPSLRDVTFVAHSKYGEFSDESVMKVTDMMGYHYKETYEHYAGRISKYYMDAKKGELKMRFVDIF